MALAMLPPPMNTNRGTLGLAAGPPAGAVMRESFIQSECLARQIKMCHNNGLFAS
jgi:hypothetical protein